MNRKLSPSSMCRLVSSRLGALLVLFQRTPLVQMLFPEARVLSSSGLGDVATWTIATIAGLGAYDSVAGATTINQLAPSGGAATVPAAKGSNLQFVFQVVGTESAPESWQIVGTLPAGLTHTNSVGSTIDSITGTPTQSGNFTITVKAWEGPNNTKSSVQQAFTINVGSQIITTQPNSLLIASGDTATLTVGGNGAGLTYQWYRGTAPNTSNLLGGETSASFTTPPLTTATKYWVRVTRNGIDADSDTATVSIGAPPAVTTQPVSKTINSGTTANLTVAFSGTSPTIQWYRGAAGVTTNPVAGATSNSFTTPILTSNASFWARATNSLGSDDSNAATITVVTAPAITGQPAPVTIDTGNTAVLTVETTGTSPAFQWYAGESGNISNPVPGATASTFTTPVLTSPAKYWVRASNSAGSVDSDAVTVSVNTPPEITGEPASTAVNSGGSATLTVTASGTNPTFQWYVGNSGDTSAPIPEATLASYTTPALTDSTSYWVRASNALGSDDSSTATVTVQLAPVFTTPPQSVTINSGASATFSFVATGVSPTFQWYLGESGDASQPIPDATGNTYATPALTETTRYWVRASSVAGDTDSATVTATVITPPLMMSQPAASTTVNSGQTATFTVSASGTSPAFQWYIGTSGDTSTPVAGATSATFTTSPLTSDTSFWVRATNAAGSADSDAAAVIVITPPEITINPASPTINPGATVTLSITATGTSPTYQWYEGTTGATGKPVVGAISAQFTTPSLTKTTTYWVRATNAAGNDDSPSAIVSVRVPPAIKKQPASATIRKGKKAKLSVTATGTTPTYQWYKGSSGNMKSPVAGARSASFTTPALKATTTYWVRVRNPAGSVNSKTVTVKVKSAPPVPEPSKASGLDATDADGYSEWSHAHFNTEQLRLEEISGPAADPDRDGIANRSEYLFGMSPLASQTAPVPEMTVAGNRIFLTFIAREATGPGYHGLERHYSLETADEPDSATWSPLPGGADIVGKGQHVKLATAATPIRFYRLNIRLAPAPPSP